MKWYIAKSAGGFINTDPEYFLANFTCVHSIFVYVIVKKIVEKFSISNYLQRIIKYLGSLTFGVYLIHELMMNIQINFSVYDRLYGLLINKVLTSLVYCFYIFVLCCFIVGILRKIPILKKLL